MNSVNRILNHAASITTHDYIPAFAQNFLSRLSPTQQKIIAAVVCIALGVSAALFIAYRCYLNKRDPSPPSPSPQPTVTVIKSPVVPHSPVEVRPSQPSQGNVLDDDFNATDSKITFDDQKEGTRCQH